MHSLRTYIFVARFFSGIIGMLFLSPLAYANEPNSVDMNVDSINQANQEAPRMIRVEGALICDLANSNSGQTCSLQIVEAKSGRTYSLVPSELSGFMMRMYHSGSKLVAIEGTLAGADAIHVHECRQGTPGL